MAQPPLRPARRAVPLVVAACLLALAAPSARAAVKVHRGVVYGHARVDAPEPASAPLRLDLYRPPEHRAVRRPAVVLIHGGGFNHGTRSDPRIVRIARALAGEGIVAASIDYRLVQSAPVPSSHAAALLAGLPAGGYARATIAAVDDTLHAIAYLRGHAGRLRVDPGRIGVIGSSAGAITADHVAYTLDDHGLAEPDLRFVGDLWGGITVAPPGGGPGALQLDQGEAPLFAVHGDADVTVPVQLDDQLVARAGAQGVRHEYLRIPGGSHGYGGSGFFTRDVRGRRTPFDQMLSFARAALGPRQPARVTSASLPVAWPAMPVRWASATSSSAYACVGTCSSPRPTAAVRSSRAALRTSVPGSAPGPPPMSLIPASVP